MALASAAFVGSSDALAKQLLVKSDERVVGWGKMLFTLPWAGLLLMVEGWPKLTAEFWMLMACVVPLEVTAFLCYLKAIRISPLSLAIPFLAFTPLFTVATGWLFLGEKVTPLGLVGVLGVTVGAYVLQVGEVKRGFLEPGIQLMLCAAAIYSITATLGKRVIILCGPTAFPFLYIAMNLLVLGELARRAVPRRGSLAAEIRSQFWLYVISGIVSAGAIATHALGILWVPVAYFLSIKRLSLLVSVMYGGLLFREDSFRQRIAGSSFMLMGAALIVLTAR